MNNLIDIEPGFAFVWPKPFVEDNESNEHWPDLSQDDSLIEKWVIENKKILMRCVTWNLCAKDPPAIEDLKKKLLPPNKFHLLVIGTEECERSIAQSALNPSKKNWENMLIDTLGPKYTPIRSHTLQAIHIIAFVHKAVAFMCTSVTSAAVPTGAGNTLGNKGGTSIFLKFCSTKILIVNAHLAAHQDAENQRNLDFDKINKSLPSLLERKGSSLEPSEYSMTGDFRRPLSTKPSFNITASPIREEVDSDMVTGRKSSGDVDLGKKESLTENLSRKIGDGSKEVQPSSPTTYDVTNSSTALNEDNSTSVKAVSFRNNDLEIDNQKHSLQEENSPVQSDNDMINQEQNGIVSIDGSSTIIPSIKRTNSNVSKQSATSLSTPRIRTLDQCGDVVVFMGDLNYRIKGNRAIIDRLLEKDMHEVLVQNDQLRINMDKFLVLQGFVEPPITFRPTYKLDIGKNSYDSSVKNRIPAWTDRILHVKSNFLHCLEYFSDSSITTSDHRPVFASFIVSLNVSSNILSHKTSYMLDSTTENSSSEAVVIDRTSPEFTSESQVCSIS
eukprot:gene5682-7844_t